MAELKHINKGRLAASSILEVVVSMVIIVMVLGISLMIYTNVMRQSLSQRELKAQFLLRQAIQWAELHPDETLKTADGWQIEQQITPFEAEANLCHLYLTAYDEDHNRIAEIHKIIIRSLHE